MAYQYTQYEQGVVDAINAYLRVHWQDLENFYPGYGSTKPDDPLAKPPSSLTPSKWYDRRLPYMNHGTTAMYELLSQPAQQKFQDDRITAFQASECQRRKIHDDHVARHEAWKAERIRIKADRLLRIAFHKELVAGIQTFVEACNFRPLWDALDNPDEAGKKVLNQLACKVNRFRASHLREWKERNYFEPRDDVTRAIIHRIVFNEDIHEHDAIATRAGVLLDLLTEFDVNSE
jgi:hypothetical protein